MATRDDIVPGPHVTDLPLAILLLTAAAFAGNVVGYEIGRGIGPPLYERDGRILKKKYFDQTDAFFDKHGNKALVIGRFVPFVRTYITVVAGRDPDGAAPVLPVERRRRGALGRQHHPDGLLPRPQLPEPGRATSTRRSS